MIVLKNQVLNPPSLTNLKKTPGLQMPAILQMIHDQFNDLTLTQLASAFHYNPEHLSKRLKKETGKSFQALITEERIAYAKSLLTTTSLSVETIGLKAGYTSLVSFSRRFSQITGCSPSEYRQNFAK